MDSTLITIECVDEIADGEMKIVYVDGTDQVLVINQGGDTFVLRASPRFELLATNTIGDEIMCASPVISDGQLFLRTYEALWCVGKSSE
jgi:hypothetical protein